MNMLSTLIYEKRKVSGLSQERLAEVSNVSRITIRRYENGDFKNLDFKQLFDISKALNFNLINYLSVYFEGLSMEEYVKLFELHKMILNLQKEEVEKFISENKNNSCFSSKIGRELFFYASALVADEKKDYWMALQNCGTGLDTNLELFNVKEMRNKSPIFLKLMVLSASLLLKLDNCKRSEQIYSQVYTYISKIDYTESLFRNELFDIDFDEFRIVILCNLTHIYNNTSRYKESIASCDEAIKLMSKNKSFKFFYPVVVNKALALYKLNAQREAKAELFKVYHLLMSIDAAGQIKSFKKLIAECFPEIENITEQMKELDIDG